MADRRIFTDNRFPGLEVVNEGRTFRAELVEAGQRQEVDQFESMELFESDELSQGFAARMAARYFDRLHEDVLRQIDEEDELDALGLPSDRDAHDIVNNPGKDFSDTFTVLTPDEVLAMWERAQGLPDGPEKEALMRQVRRAASELESTAEEVVSRLLG